MVALMVILTMAGFIVIDGFVQYAQAQSQADVAVEADERVPIAPVDLNVPDGIFLSPRHTWLRILENGRVRIGLDGLVAGLVGRISAVVAPQPGQAIQKGQPLFAIRSGDRSLELASPLTGTVFSVNDQTVDPRDVFGDAPHTKWVCEVDVPDVWSEVKSMRLGADAAAWLRSEAEKMSEFVMLRMTGNTGVGSVLADGGVPTSGALESLDDDGWAEFQIRFLGSTKA